jgi:hypothetical protein
MEKIISFNSLISLSLSSDFLSQNLSTGNISFKLFHNNGSLYVDMENTSFKGC